MNDDIVDLAAFRAARTKKKSTDATPRRGMILRINEDATGVELDHPDLDFVLTWTADNALETGRQFMHMGGALRAYQRANDPEVIAARAEERKRKDARRTVRIVGKDGRRLPPLKVRGWALETWGGQTGPNAPQVWVRMTTAQRTEHAARKLIEDYVSYGYPRDHIRIVPVDHRGRIIPSERMPKA